MLSSKAKKQLRAEGLLSWGGGVWQKKSTDRLHDF